MARKDPLVVVNFPPERLNVLRGRYELIALSLDAATAEQRRAEYTKEYNIALHQARKSLKALQQLEQLPAPSHGAAKSLQNQILQYERRIKERAEKLAREQTAPPRGAGLMHWLAEQLA